MFDRVAIGFDFAFDWMESGASFFEPIAYRCNAISPKQMPITFDTRVKTALTLNVPCSLKENNQILRKVVY